MPPKSALGWFQVANGPGPSSSHVFESFRDMVKAFMPGWATRETEPEVIVSWELPNQSDAVGWEVEEAHPGSTQCGGL